MSNYRCSCCNEMTFSNEGTFFRFNEKGLETCKICVTCTTFMQKLKLKYIEHLIEIMETKVF